MAKWRASRCDNLLSVETTQDRLRSSIFPEKRRLCPPAGTAWGLGWSPNGTEIWFSSTRLGYGRYLSAVNLAGKERLLAREPGTLTLHDVAKDGRVLITRDVPRVGMVGMTAGSTIIRSGIFPGLTGRHPKICLGTAKSSCSLNPAKRAGRIFHLSARHRWVACYSPRRRIELCSITGSKMGIVRSAQATGSVQPAPHRRWRIERADPRPS